MNIKYHLIFLLTAASMLVSCKKYLDVQPEASYTELQVYSNETALQQAFNGLYLDISSNTLYGANMTTTVVELLAQRYKPVRDLNGSRDLSAFNNYDYSFAPVQQILDSIWRKSYQTILATNVFLSKIDNSIASRVIAEANGKQLKGEAIALRAMLHFDMLRMFGPVYASGSSIESIPYYTEANGRMQPLLPASEAIDKILADLNEAEALLANDPVTTQGVVYSADFYSAARNQRLNYFAVKALKARASLWAGKTDLAHAAALSVINDGEKWFPWVNADAVTNAANPDRIFMSEVMFGVSNPLMYNAYDTYFNPAVADAMLMAPDPARLTEVYEGLLQDYRMVQTWLFGNGRINKTFFKYAPTLSTSRWRFVQPLIRKSEMYFILAETDADPTRALEYLNTARRRRGLANLQGTPSLSVELRKEYQKEFWGEGQLFFYYKRINATGVPSASMPYVWATVNPVYNIPLPFSETTTR